MAQEQNQDNTGTDPKMFTQEELDAIIESRLKRVKNDGADSRVTELESKLAQLEQEKQSQLETQLEEQKRYKELAEERARKLAELQPKAEQLSAYEETLQKTADALIEEIPEDLRSLVPEIPVAQKLEWLQTNRAKLIKPVATSTAAGVRGAGGAAGPKYDLTPEEIAIARKFNMTDEDYAKHKDK